MGNIESAEGENLPELKKMKLILDKGHYKVFESPENNKYDFWSLKSSEYSFKEELKIAEEIKKRDLIGIAKIENVQLTLYEKLFKKYYVLSILTEHPLYTLREYLLKKAKNQCLDSTQIIDLLLSVVNAQYLLGQKKQYLGFDNIHTSDGKFWKIKPFVETKSFYLEIQEYKSKNLKNFDMSGFPSPEELNQSNCDTDRVQIFGLGMLILELITQKKSKDIYSKFIIDEDLFQQRINLLRTHKKNYSGKFIELTIDMLDLDIVRRPNYDQLYKKLNSPESKIDSEVKDSQIEPIDQNKSILYNLFQPPLLQQTDVKITSAISKIEQPGNSKVVDHQIKISKTYQNQQNQVIENFQYFGPYFNGNYHGEGKLYTQNHQLLYEGGFYEGQYNNFGKLNFLNTQILKGNFNYQDCTNIDQYASIYEGQFQNGKKHGEGKLFLTNGEVFIGTFLNNLINGKGRFELNNQLKFSGFWEKGILQSNIENLQSFQNSKNNEQFEGLSKLDTKRSQQFECEGFGDTQTQNILSDIKEENLQQLYYDDQKTKIKYKGEIHQGQKHGKGILYFMNGKDQYNGDFKNDQYDGYGTLYNENQIVEDQINYSLLREVQIKGYWKRYQGTFQNGLKCGQGTWYLTNNSEFIGIFDKDLPNGEGVIRRINHEDFSGNWENGVLTRVISGKL
ncbi:unnamed protein product [Paramecium pentaurelia]|uniref:Protein kinase-like domain n=1 Tax=Paramecium pentaurelia TaxID=43138 RepID=A0A8S1U2H9_9CILI|nr:unnamed protein product [Paramecium pentaurelia]